MALGGHVEQCDNCGATRIAYNSCRNRHFPKGLARVEWLAQRQAELLPVPYFPVVFTLPTLAGEIVFQNKATIYAILLRAAAETLITIAADPRPLSAQIGVTAVLHTWGQTLQHQPHIHCVVPGGGPSLCCALPVAVALRQSLIELSNSRFVQQGQETKMEQVYKYLTGMKFRQRVEAVIEKFNDMRDDLDRERKFMGKQWSKREAQILTVVDSTAGMVGDLQGIAGKAMPEIPSLDMPLLEAPTDPEAKVS